MKYFAVSVLSLVISCSSFASLSCKSFLENGSIDSFSAVGTSPFLTPNDLVLSNESTSAFETMRVETFLGALNLKKKTIQDIQKSLALHNASLETRVGFIKDVLNGELAPSFVNSNFLDWVTQGYKFAKQAEVIEHTNSPSLLERFKDSLGIGSKSEESDSNLVDLGSYKNKQLIELTMGVFGIDDQQIRGEREFVVDQRRNGLTSPLIFRSDRINWGDAPHGSHSHLNDFELNWLFRILHREAVVRSAIIASREIDITDTSILDETVFFISAFPEFFPIHAQIEQLGFEFGSYLLTDGVYSSSEATQIYTNQDGELTGSLYLNKRIEDDREMLSADIGIRGEAYGNMSVEAEAVFRNYINGQWLEFQKTQPLSDDINITIVEDEGYGFDLTVNASLSSKALVSAQFLLFLNSK